MIRKLHGLGVIGASALIVGGASHALLACSSSTGATTPETIPPVTEEADSATGTDGSFLSDGGTALKGGGSINIYSQETTSSLVAAFAVADPNVAPANCTNEVFGSCKVRVCAAYEAGTPPPVTMAPNAGAITLTGALIAPPGLTIAPTEANGAYVAGTGNGSWWVGAETLTISAAGGTIAAFTETIPAPNAQLNLATPVLSASTILAIPRSADFGFTWDLGTVPASGTLAMTFGSSGAEVLVCEFSVAAKSGTLPAAALAKMPKGAGYLSSAVTTTASSVHSDYLISLVAVSPAKANGVELSAVALDFE